MSSYVDDEIDKYAYSDDLSVMVSDIRESNDVKEDMLSDIIELGREFEKTKDLFSRLENDHGILNSAYESMGKQLKPEIAKNKKNERPLTPNPKIVWPKTIFNFNLVPVSKFKNTYVYGTYDEEDRRLIYFLHMGGRNIVIFIDGGELKDDSIRIGNHLSGYGSVSDKEAYEVGRIDQFVISAPVFKRDPEKIIEKEIVEKEVEKKVIVKEFVRMEVYNDRWYDRFYNWINRKRDSSQYV